MSKEQFSLVEQKVLEMLEERAIQKVVPIQGKPVSDNFLKSQQNGTSALSQILSRTGRFAMQDRSRVYFLNIFEYVSVPLNIKSHKFVRF